jgi:hypothetical protein
VLRANAEITSLIGRMRGECHSLGAYPRIGDAPEYPETFRESSIDAVGP